MANSTPIKESKKPSSRQGVSTENKTPTPSSNPSRQKPSGVKSHSDSIPKSKNQANEIVSRHASPTSTTKKGTKDPTKAPSTKKVNHSKNQNTYQQNLIPAIFKELRLSQPSPKANHNNDIMRFLHDLKTMREEACKVDLLELNNYKTCLFFGYTRQATKFDCDRSICPWCFGRSVCNLINSIKSASRKGATWMAYRKRRIRIPPVTDIQLARFCAKAVTWHKSSFAEEYVTLSGSAKFLGRYSFWWYRPIIQDNRYLGTELVSFDVICGNGSVMALEPGKPNLKDLFNEGDEGYRPLKTSADHFPANLLEHLVFPVQILHPIILNTLEFTKVREHLTFLRSKKIFPKVSRAGIFHGNDRSFSVGLEVGTDVPSSLPDEPLKTETFPGVPIGKLASNESKKSDSLTQRPTKNQNPRLNPPSITLGEILMLEEQKLQNAKDKKIPPIKRPKVGQEYQYSLIDNPPDDESEIEFEPTVEFKTSPKNPNKTYTLRDHMPTDQDNELASDQDHQDW